ncbi:PREDICTED: BRISC and BRCA1-A complex member 1 [Sturnus vulgaris]|uniref:BRISC and BRCA1-A complex member 1 n=1 Tax=Sturnus vulgaris TaxID=9172 RepID=UPI00071A8205|nr:PREDICTED: BRISC and BRCA1-A complex member 1 [Sturnus vulgaris]
MGAGGGVGGSGVPPVMGAGYTSDYNSQHPPRDVTSGGSELTVRGVSGGFCGLSGFTSDPREVCSCLYDLDTVVCQSFNLDGLFNLIQQKIELPVTDNVQTIPPPFVVRTILVFGRPRCQPQFCGGEHVKDMFSFFGSLDTKGTNYKYEVPLAGPALELHNCMAKLLAHPLQRPCQSHAAYGLLEGGDSPDSEATV